MVGDVLATPLGWLDELERVAHEGALQVECRVLHLRAAPAAALAQEVDDLAHPIHTDPVCVSADGSRFGGPCAQLPQGRRLRWRLTFRWRRVVRRRQHVCGRHTPGGGLARLGCGRAADAKVREHAFFAGLDFEKLVAREIAAPWQPTVASNTDASHFDPCDIDHVRFDASYKDETEWDADF